MEDLKKIIKLVDDAQGAFYRKYNIRSKFLSSEIKNGNIIIKLISENKIIIDSFKYKL